MDVVYFDIKKAFDSVPHDQLIIKLQSMGISGIALAFFQAYLSNRQQCVVINNTLSDLVSVSSGVPQGSILGPLLFIIYINVPSKVLYCIHMLTTPNVVRKLFHHKILSYYKQILTLSSIGAYPPVCSYMTPRPVSSASV